jgi:hypothetical protein
MPQAPNTKLGNRSAENGRQLKIPELILVPALSFWGLEFGASLGLELP